MTTRKKPITNPNPLDSSSSFRGLTNSSSLSSEKNEKKEEKENKKKNEEDEDDEEDTFPDSLEQQALLRHQHNLLLHRLSLSHRNSLHITPNSLNSSFNSSSSSVFPNNQLTIPTSYDKKLRRLSDPGGGIFGNMRTPEESKINHQSGKLCDPRLQMIRSLSPSKTSEAAGEEGEALTPPPHLNPCRSSRSKSVFQLPFGFNPQASSGFYGVQSLKGDGRNRSMSVSCQPQSCSFLTSESSETPTKARPDSPTPSSFFEKSKPKLTSPPPLISSIFKMAPSVIIQEVPSSPPKDTKSPQPSPSSSPSSSPTKSCASYVSSSSNVSGLYRRRRSISLEATKLDAILEENTKGVSITTNSIASPTTTVNITSSSSISISSSIRQMSLPNFDNS